jgi:cytochrome c oxidase subunit 1
MVALTITNYGYPIVQLMMTPEGRVPPVFVGGQP